jgi:hypothetical protein
MADKKCPQCGIWSTGSALHCDCGYNFEIGIVTEPSNKLKSHHYLKYPALLVGIGVAILHALISYFLDAPSYCSPNLSLVLLAPAIAITHLIGLLLISPEVSQFLDALGSDFGNMFLSSFIFGIVGGLVASRNVLIRIIGFVSAIYLLIIPVGYLVLLLIIAGGSCA